MSMDAVEEPLLDVIGTVGVRPKEAGAAGLADGFGMGRPGIAGADGMGGTAACGRLAIDGGGMGSGATEVTGGGGAGIPLVFGAPACVGGEADGG